MDLAASCKDKLAYFRIKELKDVLSQLGLSKQGKKQDLVDRILAALADDRASGMWTKKSAVGKDDVAKLVDDTYRKMQVSGATELATRSQGVSEGGNVIKPKEEIEDSYQPEKIRCPCGSTLRNDSMIKCEDPKCGVWQHIGCVIISDKTIEGATPTPPDTFYCEICRLSRADPFWLLVATPLHPVKLAITNVPADGTNPVQSVEKTFHLTRADRDLLSKPEYDVQAWCMLLNDKVPFRMQWPQYADLQVNGVPVRAINRPGSQLLGANGRDDGPIITPCTRDGINRISLTGCDMRVFCLGVRIVKRRTVQQIMNMIPKESEGERFEDALARVKRCIGGGTATENADSDSDLEVVADFIPVNLRCPMSGSRMKVAGRFKPCVHMGCFDLDVFVEMNQRSRKWQCPICLKNYALENIIIDPYFNRIALKLRGCGEDVNEVEVKPDGSWRAKTEGDRRSLGDLGLWHAPDGSLCVSTDVESKPKPDILKQIKQEGGSDGHTVLKLGMKKRNGFWEISKPVDGQTYSSGNKLNDDFYQRQDIIPMSSSASGSGKDGEDPSVNQDGGENLDYATGNGIELESISLNIDPSYGYGNPPAPVGDNEIIVLSDSDEENEPLISSGAAYKGHKTDGGGVSYSIAPHGIPDPYPEDPALNPSYPGIMNGNDEDLMHMWSLLPPTAQAGPGFQLFGSDGDVSDALVDMQPNSINCPINGYTLGGEVGPAGLVPESSVEHPHGNINEGSVDNPLVFGDNDQSLQIFLPTRPTDASVQGELRDQPDVSNGIQNEDWISLRLGTRRRRASLLLYIIVGGADSEVLHLLFPSTLILPPKCFKSIVEFSPQFSPPIKAKMLCSISAPGKSSSKWLDRLRSSKGFPPGADLDLEQFLNDCQSSSPPNLERDRPTSTSDPNCSRNDRKFEAQNPDGDTRLLSMMSNVLAELFVMGGNSNSLPSKKCSRKQPNPKFCAAIDSPGSNTHNNNSGSNENAHALMKNESSSPMSDHNSGVGMAKDRSSDEQLKLVDDVKCGDEEEKEKGCTSLLGFSRTEVTVIDTSFATWKFEKMLFRKKNVWKVRDKNGKMVNLGKKKKKRKASALDNGNSGGAEDKKQKVLHGQCSLSKKGSGGAINEETSQSNKSDTIGKPSKKNSDKGSSVVLIKNIPTSKKIGMSGSRSCPKSTQRPPKP